jgi:carboxypeptidase C (cathepsin A)
VTQSTDIANIKTLNTAQDTRLTNIEALNTTQSTNITSLTSRIVVLEQGRVLNVNVNELPQMVYGLY